MEIRITKLIYFIPFFMYGFVCYCDQHLNYIHENSHLEEAKKAQLVE
jgi:hypothetical protein